jgi:SAM-dependent methyltransferase
MNADTASPNQKAEAAAAVYQGLNLAVYDSLVLGLNTRFTWRCPNSRIIELYKANLTANHLDIGVGTGYFLCHAGFPPGKVRLGLLDLSPASLALSAKHLARYKPENYLANVLEPIRVAAPFDSVGLNYVLHCVPGTMETKRAVFRNVHAILNPGGVLFGATVLQTGVDHGWLARKMLPDLQRKGIFSNQHDDLAGLERNLGECFSTSSVDVVGSVAIFRAWP